MFLFLTMICTNTENVTTSLAPGTLLAYLVNLTRSCPLFGFVSVVAICATTYLITRQVLSWLRSIDFTFRPVITIRSGDAALEPADDVDVPQPTDAILRYCAMESEDYAREQMLRDAHTFYRRFEDWDVVLLQLQIRAGDVKPPEAEEAA